MFEFIGSTFINYLEKYVNQTSASLSLYVGGFTLSAMTLYFLFVGYGVMRGGMQQPISTITWKISQITLILFFATGVGVYQTEVIGSIRTISEGLINTVNIGAGDCNFDSSGELLLRSMDCNAKQGLAVLNNLFDLALSKFTIVNAVTGEFIDGITLFFCAGIYFIGYAILMVALGLAFFTNLITLNLTLAVGPLFIAALAWPPTSRFTAGWVNKVVYCLVFQLFIVVYMGLCFSVFSEVITHDFSNPSALAALQSVISIFMTFCLLAFITAKLDNIANSIVGGGDSSSGLGLTAMAVAAYLKFKSKDKSSTPNSGGGGGGSIENNSQPSDSGGGGRSNSGADDGVHPAHRIAERERNRRNN